ncbi:MAG: hypothetical protein RR022_09175, partial [Angelakisella sp.]
MIEKYRVGELAKDLGVAAKEIAATVEERFPGEPRKSQTVLTGQELDFVFEKYTQKSSQNELKEYFALKAPVKEAAAPAPVAAPVAAPAAKPVAPVIKPVVAPQPVAPSTAVAAAPASQPTPSVAVPTAAASA